jgi:D-3-phosphoglycerate dehydrogenase
MKKNEKVRILVTTYPYLAHEQADYGLTNDKIDFYTNTKKRKLNREEHLEILDAINPHIIIAGTEAYDSQAFDACPSLVHLCRVGIGIDAIDIDECTSRGVRLTNTPDAPTNSVAELTVCQILNALRRTRDADLRNAEWNRVIGRELKPLTVGIIGFGRIGKAVTSLLAGMCKSIYVNDIDPEATDSIPDEYVKSKGYIYRNCDIITIHTPLTSKTNGLIRKADLDDMPSNIILVNMSRGGIIRESAAYEFLMNNPDAVICIDTFDEEPYKGPLTELPNALLTPHLGSCSRNSRYDMEHGAMIAAMDTYSRMIANA